MKVAFVLFSFLSLTGFSLIQSLRPSADEKSMIQVMYQMESEAKALKKHITEKHVLPAKVDSIMDMRSSVPTDPDEITEGFRVMAEENLKRRSMIFTAGNAKMAFNKYVKSCITCHQQHCPGPIRRISSLYID